MPLALAVAAGIAADRCAAPWGTPAWVGLAIGFAALSAVAAKGRWLGAIALLGTYAALAGGWHHYRWSDVAGDDLARKVDETPRPAWVKGILREVLGFRPGLHPEDTGVTRAVLEITRIMTADGWREASGQAMVTVVGDRSDLRAGWAVQAAGSLARAARPLNPGEFDYRAYLQAQGIRLRLAVDGPSGVWADRSGSQDSPGLAWLPTRGLGAVQAWSQERLARGLDPSTAPLAAALLLGRREGVDPDVNDAFARTGTTHLLAISGLHMQVLALALGGVLRLLGIRRRTTFSVIGVATVAYALLVGWMPSVVRSAAMTVTYCGAGLVDRRSRPANTLAAAAIVTLGLNPAHLFDVGCQLSFLAVGAIVWAVEPVSARVRPGKHPDPLTALERTFEPRWRKRVRKGATWLAQGLVLSTVVWLAALPLVALRFHLVSPVGIVLNVPLIPMTSAALLAAGISLGLAGVWEPLGRPAGWVAARLLDATEQVVRWGVSQRWGHTFVPEPSWIWVLGFYLALGLATASTIGRWRGRRIAMGLLAAWSAIGLGMAVAPELLPRRDGPPRAEVLAVGHGLAVVIETGGGRAVLYDCGRMRDPSVGRRVVAPALWARGVRRLDAVILSHADADHYDGLPDLLDRVRIAAVLVPEEFANDANPGASALLALVRSRGVVVRTIAEGQTWAVGSTRFMIRHPPRGWSLDAPDNVRSVVLDVSWRDRHALLTGDLEGEGLAALVAQPPGGPIDVLLSPHHGGRAANPSWLYDWADPALVVVSQRPPPAASRDALAALRSPLLRTWQRGAVRLSWTEGGITARGFLDGERKSLAADKDDERR
jgi:competence protein ComEC